MKAVVSLLPAATEVVCALGGRDSLTGISHECDFPRGLEDLPRLTRSRVDAGGLSRNIHYAVTDMIQNALSIYEIDVAALDAARPDVVVTQDLCEVCAVSSRDVCSAVAEFTGRQVEIVSLQPSTLEDIFSDIGVIGDAIGRRPQADRLCHSLQERLASLSKRLQDCNKRTVLMVEWLEPVMIGGLWSAQLADYCRATALCSKVGVHARTLSRTELEAIDPDVVVIKPCGFPLQQTLKEVGEFEAIFPWETWTAVEQDQVFVVDGNAYFNRSGPRIVDSTEILAACVHPLTCPDLVRRYQDEIVRVRHDLSQESIRG